MKRIVLLAATAGFAACGVSSPTSPSAGGSSDSAQGLAGTWRATRAEFVSATNSNVRVEVISLGTTMTLSLDATGSYSQRITDPGQQGSTQTGTWSASRDVLTLRPSGVSFSIQFDFTLNGNTLTLAGGHVEFDVNGDDVNEEAILNATLARQ